MCGRSEAVKTQDSPLAFCSLRNVFSWLLALSHREALRDTFPVVFINQQLVQRRSTWLHWDFTTFSTTETRCELPVASLMTQYLCHLQFLSKDSKHEFLLQRHKSLSREIMLSSTPKAVKDLKYTVKTVNIYPAEHWVYRHTNQTQNQPITEH